MKKRVYGVITGNELKNEETCDLTKGITLEKSEENAKKKDSSSLLMLLGFEEFLESFIWIFCVFLLLSRSDLGRSLRLLLILLLLGRFGLWGIEHYSLLENADVLVLETTCVQILDLCWLNLVLGYQRLD